MDCPHCGKTLPFLSCQKCGREVPEKSLFCCWCGDPVKAREEETGRSERIPCSDGTCIGTINEIGACSICGRPASST